MGRKMAENCPVFSHSQTVQTDEINKLAGIDIAAGAKIVQVQQAAIAYNDSGKALMTLPVGAKILEMYIEVTTAFNATSPTYTVGYSSDADALANITSDLAAVGRVTASPPAATIAEWNGVTVGSVIGTAGGTGGTADAGVLKIAYYV